MSGYYTEYNILVQGNWIRLGGVLRPYYKSVVITDLLLLQEVMSNFKTHTKLILL
jgi:hypothetical protein